MDCLHGKCGTCIDEPVSKSSVRQTEQELLKEIAGGKLSAFWSLWELHKKRLYRLCLKMMGYNSAEADDALSRAMLLACEKMPCYADRIVNPSTWLDRLTHNQCVDIHRERQRRENYFELTEDPDSIFSTQSSIQDDQPEREFFLHELNRLLFDAIEQLPERLRDAFVMRCLEELDYERIANLLGITQANVRKRVQQARSLMVKKTYGYIE